MIKTHDHLIVINYQSHIIEVLLMNLMKKILIVLLCCSGIGVNAKELQSDQEKLSYSMGVVIAKSIENRNIDLDIPSFIKAIEAVLKGESLDLTTADIQQRLNDYEQQQQTTQAASAKQNKTAGEQYLAQHKKKKGVTTLPSGLQYKILKAGQGKKPKADSMVLVHYHGTLIDGTEFDSSYTRGEPIELGVNRVIKGWQEALQLMPTGSKWQIAIPSELAYGARGAGAIIGPNAALLFDIELLEIK